MMKKNSFIIILCCISAVCIVIITYYISPFHERNICKDQIMKHCCLEKFPSVNFESHKIEKRQFYEEYEYKFNANPGEIKKWAINSIGLSKALTIKKIDENTKEYIILSNGDYFSKATIDYVVGDVIVQLTVKHEP